VVDAAAMKRLLVCMALSAAIGCSSSSSQKQTNVPITPVTPAPIVPSTPALAGTWTGMFDVSSCVGSADWCQRTEPEAFSLHLDGSLYGVAEIELARRQPVALDILQSNDTDGSTTLKGVSTISGQPGMELEIRLEGSAPSSLTGSVRYSVTGGPFGAPASSAATRSGPILFIRPVTIVRAGELHGTWRGYMKRTACSGDCDQVRQIDSVTLWLSQQGSALSASFNGDALEGSASGRDFTLTSLAIPTKCRDPIRDATVCQDSYEFRGSVDSLSRMRGTIQRRRLGHDYYDGPFSWTATFELEGVVRQKGLRAFGLP
jgi:hypothetical protein